MSTTRTCDGCGMVAKDGEFSQVQVCVSNMRLTAHVHDSMTGHANCMSIFFEKVAQVARTEGLVSFIKSHEDGEFHL